MRFIFLYTYYLIIGKIKVKCFQSHYQNIIFCINYYKKKKKIPIQIH